MIEPDPYLVHISRWVDKAHADGRPLPAFEVSLVSGGLIIEGSLISQQEFFQLSHRALQKLSELREDAAATQAIEFETTTKIVDDLTAEPFIHIREVRFWSPGADPHGPSEIGCWRIRVASIDGFTFHEDPLSKCT